MTQTTRVRLTLAAGIAAMALSGPGANLRLTARQALKQYVRASKAPAR